MEQHAMTATQKARKLKKKYERDYKELMKEAWTEKAIHVVPKSFGE